MNSLLTHRMRGFDHVEGSLEGLQAALNRNVEHIEFDLRATKDNQLVVAHNPTAMGRNGILEKIRDRSCQEAQNNLNLAGLIDMMEMIDASGNKDATLYLDVKDYGFEQQIIDLVSKYQLEDRIVIVSWLPSVLYEVHRINEKIRLCFSHVSCSKAPWIFPMITFLYNCGALPALRTMTKLFSNKLHHELTALCVTMEPTNNPVEIQKDTKKIGFNHAHILSGIIEGPLLKILQKTNGMVCIPLYSVNQDVIDKFHDVGIEVSVFSVKSRNQLNKIVSKFSADIIFSDDATLFDR